MHKMRGHREGGRACARRRVTAGRPSSAASRSRTRSESRSSSCAQTAEVHATVTTPSRSDTGSEACANASPAAAGHARWTSASSVAGASAAVSAVERGADRARGAAPHAGDLVADRAVGDDEARDVGPVAARHVREVGGRDHALAAALAQQLDEPLAAQRVELRGDVVEQHQRRGPALGGEHAALGQQQRQQPEPLLAARPVGAQLAAGAAQHELVAVRAVAGEAALEVGVDALGELGGELLRPLGLRARPVGELRAALEPERLGAGGERLVELGDRGGAVGGEGDPVAGELLIPRRQRAAARPAGPDRAEQRVALRQRGGVGAARADAGRPQRGDHLVEVRAAQRRGAEHEVEPVGQEDGDERPRRRVGQAVDGRAVDRQALGLAGLEADRDAVASPSRSASSSSRATPAPKRTTSRSFAVRQERPVQAK